jgi:hypothetical protein
MKATLIEIARDLRVEYISDNCISTVRTLATCEWQLVFYPRGVCQFVGDIKDICIHIISPSRKLKTANFLIY